MNRPPKQTKDDRRKAAAARDRADVTRWVERLVGGFRPEEPTAHDMFFLHVI